jgi:hypothetical protein
VKLEIKAGKIPRKKLFDAEVIYSSNSECEKGADQETDEVVFVG